MLENRFPNNCYVHGDIAYKQVEVMVEWLNKVYGKTFQEPICFDADRLYEQLNAAYSDKKALSERFATLYQGSRADEFKALLRFIGKRKTYDHTA